MQGLILAAGMGKRLRHLTRDNTKCMIKVNGITLIERMLRQLDCRSLSRIVIVIGYQGQKLVDYIGTLGIRTPIEYVSNPIYDKTNNIYSLALAKDKLCEDDTLLLESDLIFEDSVLDALLSDPRETLALVDKYESWMDGTCVKLGEDDAIDSFIPGKKFVFADIPEYYKTVNIYKFSRHFSQTHYVPFLVAYSAALGNNEYYEQVLRVITMLDDPGIRAKKLTGELWYEIDDAQDLDIASSMFAPGESARLDAVTQRYGGYWRYPALTDFCYLVNPYYPPRRLMDEMMANFETCLTSYPSGMRVCSLLAAKSFGICEQHILVGNGAAELIRSLLSSLSGSFGIIRPTFEEYPNRVQGEAVVYTPDNPDFSYSAQDLIRFFSKNPVDHLIVINPDNPSGNYLTRSEVLELLDFCEERGTRLILDESFIDFSQEQGTVLSDEILAAHPSLILIKSISKSYGVPGIRLGILASGDRGLIASIRRDVAIWNINSYAEFYLQIAEKYEKDYLSSLDRVRAARQILFAELSRIPGLRPIPSEANYITVEITSGMSSRTLTKRLLADDNLFVKDLHEKTGGAYIRVAVRSEEDNARLIAALRKQLSN